MDAPPLVLPLLVLAVVLLVSGAAKLSDRLATSDMFVALQVPLVPAGLGAAVLPWAEIVLGVALLLVRGPLLVLATAATVLVFAAYWLVVARAMRFDPPVSCSCFGRLGGHRVDRSTLVRNTLLLGLAVLGLGSAVRGTSVLEGLGAYDGADWSWLGLTLVVAAIAWLIARGHSDDGPAYDGPVEEVDYEREPIPYAVLEDPDSRRSTLRELAQTRARLLVLLSPGCGPCERIGHRLDGWAGQLEGTVSVHAVYPIPLSGLPELVHGTATTLFEPDLNLTRVLGGLGTPSALLLGADGYLAGGPVSGEGAIVEMVDEVLAMLVGSPDEVA